jgi:hypothetical protein
MPEVLYYYRQSWGVGTNLQLHSLRQAWRLWNDLKNKQDSLSPSRIKERSVVIIDLLGLSLSQLLGQNFSHPKQTKTPSPEALFNSFLSVVNLTEDRKTLFKQKFQLFLPFYDACRHFGAAKHEKIDTISIDTTRDFIDLAIDIWNAVCEHFRASGEATLAFSSVLNILDDNEDDEREDDF